MSSRHNRRIRREAERAAKRLADKSGPTDSNRLLSLSTTAKAAIAAIVTIVSLIAAVVTLLPRVTVAISDPVDPEDPFSASVTITNTGFIPLDSVIQAVAIKQIGGNATNPSHDVDYVPIRRGQWQPHDLGLDDKFTFALNDIFDMKTRDFGYAHIAIWVDYRIPILYWKSTKKFPYEAHKQTNGHFYWYPGTR